MTTIVSDERYRIGVKALSQRWFVWDREREDYVGRTVATRAEALKRAERLNARASKEGTRV